VIYTIVEEIKNVYKTGLSEYQTKQIYFLKISIKYGLLNY